MENNYAYNALESIGWGKFTTLMFIQCGMAWTANNTWYTAIAYILQGAIEEWNISKFEAGILASLYQLGLLLGGYILGYISDKYGRKIAFKSTAIISAIASFVLLFSLHYYMVAICLTILGIGMAGELMLGGTAFYEFCPPSKRYFLTALSVYFCIGSTTTSLFAYIVAIINTSDIKNWRYIVAYGCIIEVVALILRMFMIETPAFLVSKQRFEEANETLNLISLKNKGIKFNADSKSFQNNDLSINTMEEDSKIEKNFLAELFSKKLIKITLILCFAYLSGSFSYSGTNYFMPEFLSEYSTSESYLIIFIQQLAGVPGVFLGSWLVETPLGRRYTTCIPFIVAGLCCFLFPFSDIPIYVIIISSFLAFFAYLAYSALFTIGPESFPTGVRNSGMGMANIFSRVGGISAPALTGAVLEIANGKQIILSVYFGFYALGGLSILFLKETRIKAKVKSVSLL